jgi:tetratricopeptide (TPR) repeat protein
MIHNLIFTILMTVVPVRSQDSTQFQIGLCYSNQGDFKQAEKHFRQALTDEPGNPYVKCELGFSLYSQKRYAEALPYLNEVIQRTKLFERAYYYKGLVYYEMKKYREAIQNFDTFQRIADRNRIQFKLSCWYMGVMYQELLYTEGLTKEETNAMVLNYQTYIWKSDDLEEEQGLQQFLDLVAQYRPEQLKGKWRLRTDAGEMAEFIETGALGAGQEGGTDFITTMADRKLQEDTYRQIKNAEGVIAKSCTTHKVIKAEFLKVTENFRSQDGNVVQGGWQELWTVDRCGTPAVYLILYEVNEVGSTYIFVKPVEADFLKGIETLDLKEKPDIKIKKK